MTYVYMDDSTCKEKFYSSVIAERPQEMFFHIDEEISISDISLEDTLAPIVELIPTILEKATLAKQNCRDPADGLSCDESAAIYLLSMRWEPNHQCLYFLLNTTLHNQDYGQISLWKFYLKLLFMALDRLRSTRITFRQDIEHYRTRRFQNNDVLVFWGLTFCSLSIDSPQKINHTSHYTKTRTTFVFDCRNAKFIGRHSSDPSSNEFLLLPTQFEFIRYLDRRNNFKIIQVRDCHTLSPLIDFVDALKHLKLLNPTKKLPSPSTTITTNNSYQNSELQRLISLHQSRSKMNLSYQNLTVHDIPMIIEQAIVGKECRELWLHNNHITFECMSILVLALPNNTTLTEIYPQETDLSDMSVQILAKALALNNSSIMLLNLNKNNITNRGARYLTDMLKTNTTLTHLYLYGNLINRKGAKLLMDGTIHQNKTLRRLDLDSGRPRKRSRLRAMVHSCSCTD